MSAAAAAHLHLRLPTHLPPRKQADKSRMLDMFSREGEKVPFEAPVEAKGNIEVWLQRLVDGMQGTMKVGAQSRLNQADAKGGASWGAADR